MPGLNQGIGGGDADSRLPAQRLRIMIPRYNNPIQIFDNGSHLNSNLLPSGWQTPRARKPLFGGRLGERFDTLRHRLRGSFK